MRWEAYKQQKHALEENERLLDRVFNLSKFRFSDVSKVYKIQLIPDSVFLMQESDPEAYRREWCTAAKRRGEMSNILHEYEAAHDGAFHVLEEQDFPVMIDDEPSIHLLVGGDVSAFRNALQDMSRDARIKDLMAPLLNEPLSP